MLVAVDGGTHLPYRMEQSTNTQIRVKNNKVIKDSSDLRDVDKAEHDLLLEATVINILL